VDEVVGEKDSLECAGCVTTLLSGQASVRRNNLKRGQINNLMHFYLI